MTSAVILTFVNLFATVFNILLLARVISSWVMPQQSGHRVIHFVYELTEPVLRPVRRILPASPGIDFAPLVAFFLIQGLVILVDRLVSS